MKKSIEEVYDVKMSKKEIEKYRGEKIAIWTCCFAGGTKSKPIYYKYDLAADDLQEAVELIPIQDWCQDIQFCQKIEMKKWLG